MNGKGKISFKDGRVIEGNFINNVLNGTIIYTFPNGNKYEDTYYNGKLEGFSKR